MLLTLVVAMASALAGLGFVAEAPNRLVSGTPLTLLALGPAMAAAAGLLLILLLALSLAPPSRRVAALSIAAALVLLIVLLAAAGRSAWAIASVQPPAARTSLGAAFWIALLAAGLAIVDALQRFGLAARLGVAAVAVAVAAAMLASPLLDQLSLLKEYAAHRHEFWIELARHCELVLGAVLPALAIGAPLGLLAARRPRWRGPLFATLNAIQTVPSIALFGLLLAPLAALGHALPRLQALGITGIGAAPAILALVLYSLLPVVRNTVAGLASVDPAAVEAASGMGMSAGQVLRRVELPLGLPVFLAGLRIVLVQAIGLTAVAALIGAGGLGAFVFQGIGQYAVDLVLLGAVPIIVLALGADFALALAIEALGRRR